MPRVNNKIPVLVITLENASPQFEIAKNRALNQRLAPHVGDLEVTEFGYPPSIENIDFSTEAAREQIDEEYIPALEKGYLLIDAEALPNTTTAIRHALDIKKLADATRARFIAVSTNSLN